MGILILPKKRNWYLKEPDNEIDRRIYRYYEVYKRVFWRIYKKVGVIEYKEVANKENIGAILTAKFCPPDDSKAGRHFYGPGGTVI